VKNIRSVIKNRIILISLIIIFLLSYRISTTSASSIQELNTSQTESSLDNNFVEVWNTGTALGGSGNFISSISTGDQDADGNKEIIVGYLYLFKVLEYDEINNNFTIVFDSGFLDTTHAVCTSDDLDEDGKNEILHGTASNYRLRIFEYNGSDNDYIKVVDEFMGPSGEVRDIYISDDLDNDGVKEIITTWGQAINTFEFNGTDNGYARTWWSPNIGWVHDICVGDDLDNDGKKEIIAASGQIHVYENTANNTYLEVWSSPLTDALAVCVGQDLDRDGKKEIITGGVNNDIVSIYEFNGTDNGYSLVWNSTDITTIDGDINSITIGNDLDEDGEFEIIAGSSNGTLYIFEFNGTDNNYNKVWDSGNLIGGSILSICIGNDLNRNGNMEFLVGTNNGKVHIFEHYTPETPPPDSQPDGIYVPFIYLIIGGSIVTVVLLGLIIALIKKKK